MTIKYTKEQLNKFDKDLLIELFLGMQGQMEELSRQTQALNDRMQLMMCKFCSNGTPILKLAVHPF